MRKYTPEEAAIAKIKNDLRNREYRSKWKKLNKDKVRASYVRCKTKHRALMAAWTIRNKEKAQEYAKKWNAENRDKRLAYKANWNAKNKHRKDFKIRNFAASQVKSAMGRIVGGMKRRHSHEYLGCSISFFAGWLESQFTGAMKWDNWGSVWHVDHITPICTLGEDATDEQIRAITHYSNLRPLLKEENLRKQRNQLPYVQPELLLTICA